MKKYLVCSLLLISVVLSGCSFNKVKENKNEVVDNILSVASTTQEQTSTTTSLTQKNDASPDTSNWNIYSDKKYNFELKYPENLKVNEELVATSTETKTLISQISFNPEVSLVEGGNGFSINVYKSNFSSLSDFKIWYENNHGSSVDSNVSKIIESKIGKFNFIDTNQGDGADSQGRYVYISNNDLVLEIVQSYRDGSLPSAQQRAILDSVLSSFVFLK